MRLAAKVLPLDREERWPIIRPARIQERAGAAREATLCELSKSGCRLEMLRPVEVGARVTLVIVALGSKDAVSVRQTDHGCALEFVTPLMAHELLGVWNRGSRAPAALQEGDALNGDEPVDPRPSRTRVALAMLAVIVLAMALTDLAPSDWNGTQMDWTGATTHRARVTFSLSKSLTLSRV